jgi:hypothetical protein
VLTRSRIDPATRAYITRRLAEDKPSEKSNAASNGSSPADSSAPSSTTTLRSTPPTPHPYTPRDNGKVERYHRILAEEFLYAHTWNSEQHRTQGATRLERPLQLPSTPHHRWKPATHHPAPHRRHQRHDLMQLAMRTPRRPVNP